VAGKVIYPVETVSVVQILMLEKAQTDVGIILEMAFISIQVFEMKSNIVASLICEEGEPQR